MEFVDVVGGVGGLGEEGVDDEAAGTGLHDEFFFGFEGSGVGGGEGDGEVGDGAFLFVAEEGEEGKRGGG